MQSCIGPIEQTKTKIPLMYCSRSVLAVVLIYYGRVRCLVMLSQIVVLTCTVALEEKKFTAMTSDYTIFSDVWKGGVFRISLAVSFKMFNFCLLNYIKKKKV